jgi:hypothetical protein
MEKSNPNVTDADVEQIYSEYAVNKALEIKKKKIVDRNKQLLKVDLEINKKIPPAGAKGGPRLNNVVVEKHKDDLRKIIGEIDLLKNSIDAQIN